MKNLITDVSGLSVGQSDDPQVATGVTAIVFDAPATASIAMLGGAPATRDTGLLEPEMTVDAVDALVLSGGSAFGLDAAGGAMAALLEQGRGFQVGSARVPIVPQAILFDLLNGGDKNWGKSRPIGTWAIRPCKTPVQIFALARPVPVTARPPRRSKAGWGPRAASPPRD
jgi:D-aminopeptidase